MIQKFIVQHYEEDQDDSERFLVQSQIKSS